MIRSIGTVLVIWGLIFQPLLAAMPAPMAGNSLHSLMALDFNVVPHAMENHGDQSVEKLSKVPCHESGNGDGLSESCDNCDMDCVTGICASSCMICGAAAFQKSLDNSSSFAAAFSGARAYGLPSRIFHPPKHA